MRQSLRPVPATFRPVHNLAHPAHGSVGCACGAARRSPSRLAGLCRTAVCLTAVCLAVWGLFACPAAQAAVTDPRQCVLEAGRAVDAADTAAFERLVDVDSILEQALDIFVRQARAPQGAKDLPPMLALLFSQAASKDGASGNVRNLLLSESRAFVLNGVASGAFAGRKVTGAEAQGLLAPLFADASTGRKEVRQVGQARRDGQGWLVPFTVYDHGNGLSYDVLGRVTQSSAGPRLTGVANMEALIRRLNAESSAVQE